MRIDGAKDTIDWYNANAEQYATTTEEHAQTEQIDDFVGLVVKNGKVLDVGCGGGRDSALLQEKGLNPIGIDLSIGLIEEAKKRHPKIDFRHANMLDIPFPNDSFDGVWAHASLLHLETQEDVRIALSEFSRITKAGGILHALVKAQTGDRKTAIVADALSNHDRFFQYFTQEEVSNLLIDAGFGVIKTEQYKETDKDPKGRPEVEWILALAKKV